MGEIVAAMATCHAPQLFTYPPDEDHAQLDASIAGMRELGKLLDETQPDVIVFLGSDHLETFSLNCVPTFAIIAGNRARAEFAGRQFDLPIHREFAEDLLHQLVKKRGKPEHLAGLIAFLASDDAEMITGQMILCDGGGYLH